MANYVILIKYRDTYGRNGTARLKVKANSPERAEQKAKQEIEKIEKFSTRKNARTFDLDSIQVIRQTNSRQAEGLLITRNNPRSEVEVWELKGSIDAKTNKQFEELLQEAIHEGTDKIVLDFTAVDYINSTGLGTIVNVNSQIMLKLANLSQKVTDILVMVGLDSLVDIYYSVEEALGDF